MVRYYVSLRVEFVRYFVLGAREAVLRDSRLVIGVHISNAYMSRFLHRYVMLLFFLRVVLVRPCLSAIRRVNGRLHVAARQSSLMRHVRVIVIGNRARQGPLSSGDEGLHA